MDLTLDYNIELFPLQSGESFALALSSSLQRGGASKADDDEEKEQDVWRPDGKGRRGLEDDYDYVMYGKVRTHVLMHLKGQCQFIVSLGVQVRWHHRRHRVCPTLVMSHCPVLSPSRTVYASFGGLLMSLTGSYRHLTSIVLGDPVYLLVRK